jgi:hypothetical protein
MLRSPGKTPVARPDIEAIDPALLRALHRRGTMRLELRLAPEGVAALVGLGWLQPRDCHAPGILADVVADLANAALNAGLRPR